MPCHSRVSFKYDGSKIVPGGQGTEYEDFKKQCTGKTARYIDFVNGNTFASLKTYTHTLSLCFCYPSVNTARLPVWFRFFSLYACATVRDLFRICDTG